MRTVTHVLSDLEEAFSYKVVLPKGQDSFTSMQEFFTRPIHYEAYRPIDRNAVLVSPADSVVQNSFFILPDKEGNIINARVPQVIDTVTRST